MNETLNWNDLRLFLAVARGGGLANAMKVTQLSAPTLGRRMLALERSLGLTLFLRKRDGYSLTLEGEELLVKAEALEGQALNIERWKSELDPPQVVKVAAGTWTSSLIARNAERLICNGKPIHLKIVSGTTLVDIARREASLGIRSKPPKVQGLAGRKLCSIGFAIYGSQAHIARNPQVLDHDRIWSGDWVAFVPDGPSMPSYLWLQRHFTKKAIFECSSAHTVTAAVIEGIGLGIFPCFVGDNDPNLVRLSKPIEELRHMQWLVSHDDDRHLAPVRAVSDWLVKVFFNSKDLLLGEIKTE